jgi:hypothetical protein
MDIVINKCYGGFGVSRACAEACGYEWRTYSSDDEWGYVAEDIDRTDPKLIAYIREHGEKANGRFAELGIVTVPDDVEWTIKEYDGIEWVAEKHRTWE